MLVPYILAFYLMFLSCLCNEQQNENLVGEIELLKAEMLKLKIELKESKETFQSHAYTQAEFAIGK